MKKYYSVVRYHTVVQVIARPVDEDAFEQTQVWPQELADKWLDKDMAAWVAEMTAGAEIVHVIRVQASPHGAVVLVEADFNGDRFRAWLRPGEARDDVDWRLEPVDGWDAIGLA